MRSKILISDLQKSKSRVEIDMIELKDTTTDLQTMLSSKIEIINELKTGLIQAIQQKQNLQGTNTNSSPLHKKIRYNQGGGTSMLDGNSTLNILFIII